MFENGLLDCVQRAAAIDPLPGDRRADGRDVPGQSRLTCSTMVDMKLALGCLLVLSACGVFRDGEATGHVESTGETGTWSFDKGLCQSGQREQYQGAIALGPEGTGIAIKLVKDPIKGWSAVVNEADGCKGAEKGGCRAEVFSEKNCKTLDVSLGGTNTTVNKVRVVEGKLTIDCKSDTSTVKGQLTFDYCH